MRAEYTKIKARDVKRVDLSEAFEVRFWTNKFTCTKTQLVQAIETVGTDAEKLEDYFRTYRAAA
jgi:hypothetical protein